MKLANERYPQSALVDDKKTFDQLYCLYFLEIFNKLEIENYLHTVVKNIWLKWTDIIIVLKMLTVLLNSMPLSLSFARILIFCHIFTLVCLLILSFFHWYTEIIYFYVIKFKLFPLSFFSNWPLNMLSESFKRVCFLSWKIYNIYLHIKTSEKS